MQAQIALEAIYLENVILDNQSFKHMRLFKPSIVLNYKYFSD